ncbi:MAG: phosphatidylserine decarboxylase family protein [Gemmataceae bacterium]
MTPSRTLQPTEPPAALPPEPMDPQVRSVQPGGGLVYQLELAWGGVRRFWLRTFRPGYVRRMEALRKGEFNGCPHPVLDPRDVKFFRNQGGYHWDPADDPFRWRDRIPFARWGLAELFAFSALTFGPAVVLAVVLSLVTVSAWLAVVGWVAVAGLAVVGGLIVWFFRDPHRVVPTEPGLVVAPADGLVVTIEEVDDPFVGPAVMIGIFLSIFNVHVNRSPVAGRVIGIEYRRGKFLNALLPASARENERMTVRFQEDGPAHRRYVVRQIAGAIARRIVCAVRPGDRQARGERFGMIKFGSRTELVLPRTAGLSVRVKVGDKVQAGATVFAAYADLPPAG